VAPDNKAGLFLRSTGRPDSRCGKSRTPGCRRPMCLEKRRHRRSRFRPSHRLSSARAWPLTTCRLHPGTACASIGISRSFGWARSTPSFIGVGRRTREPFSTRPRLARKLQGAADPETGVLFVPSATYPSIVGWTLIEVEPALCRFKECGYVGRGSMGCPRQAAVGSHYSL